MFLKMSKTERAKDMCQLKQAIIAKLFNWLSRKPFNQWWKYNGEFIYEGQHYDLECVCRMDRQMFEYKTIHISHKQIVIDIPEDFA